MEGLGQEMDVSGGGEASTDNSVSVPHPVLSLDRQHSTSWTVSLVRSTMIVEAPERETMERAIRQAQDLTRLLYGIGPLVVDPAALRQHFLELCAEFRRDGAIERAADAVRGFAWPADVFTRDSGDL